MCYDGMFGRSEKMKIENTISEFKKISINFVIEWEIKALIIHHSISLTSALMGGSAGLIHNLKAFPNAIFYFGNLGHFQNLCKKIGAVVALG